MSGASVALKKLAKPQLRGLSHSYLRNHAIVAAVLCTIGVAAYKYTIVDPRKAKYAAFYKTYDINKEYERMKKAGVFQSSSN